jgi:hypothetical protein
MSEKLKDGMMVELTGRGSSTEGTLVHNGGRWFVAHNEPLLDGGWSGIASKAKTKYAWILPEVNPADGGITPLADQPKASKPRPKEWTEVIYHVGDDVYTKDMINNDTLEIVERNMDAKIKRRDELTTEIKTIRTHLARHKRKFGKAVAKSTKQDGQKSGWSMPGSGM